ncbi:hypothetical protein ACFOPN_17210 [Xanthomonas hyacinthi]|uniref:hypothetical protein n=1 Tax=Xanthomonas hyacinthi TaxID=56455 RepID=UPI00062CFE35
MRLALPTPSQANTGRRQWPAAARTRGGAASTRAARTADSPRALLPAPPMATDPAFAHADVLARLQRLDASAAGLAAADA